MKAILATIGAFATLALAQDISGLPQCGVSRHENIYLTLRSAKSFKIANLRYFYVGSSKGRRIGLQRQ
jgi:hypothetical protein